jgi:hypothetical protein
MGGDCPMSWSMLSALFGFSPKTVDTESFGHSRIWSAPGVLEGRINPDTGQVFGSGGEFVGTIREDLLGDLSIRAVDGTTLGQSHVDAVGREHWSSGGDQLGFAQESTTGLDVFGPDGVRVASEQSVLGQVELFDAQGVPGVDLAFDVGTVDMGAFDPSAMDALAFDTSGLEFSGFDASLFDAGAIDLGCFADGIDPAVFDAIDF